MDNIPDLRAQRILLVEDNLTVAEIIGNALRAAGYLVETAYSCTDALTADHNRYVLALVNGQMQDREGHSILGLIAAHRSFSRLPMATLDSALYRLAEMSPEQLDKLVEGCLQQVANLLNPPVAAPVSEVGVTAAAPAEEPQAAAPTLPRYPQTKPLTEPDQNIRRQRDALKTLSNLARSISSVLDLSTVLNQIVDAATTLTGAEEGLLLLPDEEDSALYLRAMKGIDDDSARNFRVKSTDTLVGNVYRRGEPALVGAQGLLRVKTQYFVRSMLYVPMTYQGRIIGVLGVNNRRSGRLFAETDIELLLDLAAHAAIAIENARLYEERLLQNRRLTTLVEAGTAVNSTLALADVLVIICQQVLSAFNASGCLVQQLDTASSSLNLLAWTSRSVWRLDNGPRFSLDERPMLRLAITQNGFYVVEPDHSGSLWYTETQRLKQVGADHLLVLPVRGSQGAMLGVLELHHRGAAPEVSSEFRAHMRALALELCTLIPDKPGARAQPVVFDKARHTLRESGAVWASLALLTQENQATRVMEFGETVFLEAPYPRQMAVSAEDMNRLGSPLPCNYHSRQTDLPAIAQNMMAQYGAQTLLCLPLRIKDNPFGIFTIYSTLEARQFSPDEIDLATALITQAAAALENARLYHDLQRSLDDLKRAQATLVQATRLSAMGQLAAVVAHQINNPLTTVMVDSEIILQDLPPESPLVESVTAIRRAGERAHTVVKRLLSTARRDNSGDSTQWIEVNQTIRNTLELVSTHIERQKIRLAVDLDAAQPAYLQGHGGHLEDVWLNLLLNGRDALANVRDASLSIISRRQDNVLQVLVTDNGPGIPPSHLGQIFEPFFTTKPPGEGTGLGLYVCKQVIDECNGSISVASQPGQGTRFYIELFVQNEPLM